jgi:hypothetical protein
MTSLATLDTEWKPACTFMAIRSHLSPESDRPGIVARFMRHSQALLPRFGRNPVQVRRPHHVLQRVPMYSDASGITLRMDLVV